MDKCGIYKKDPIFTVHLLTRLEDRYYIFIGNVHSDLSETVAKMERGAKLTKKEIEILTGRYKEGKRWIQIAEKNKIQFVNDQIHMDDTIANIKNKLFVYLSDPQKDNYLLDKNQEVWVKLSSGYKLLGITYKNLKLKPSYYGKPAVDYKNFVNRVSGSKKSVEQLNENGFLLEAAVDGETICNNEIYVNNLLDEITFLESKRVAINSHIIHGYLEKYWPNGVLKINPDKVKNEYKKIQTKINYDLYIGNLIKDVHVDTSHFDQCDILQFLLHVNYKNDENVIDLLKIFKLIDLSEELPFVKYKEPDWPTPFYRIYRDAIDKLIVPRKTLRSWIVNVSGDKADSPAVKVHSKGLTLKYFLYKEGEISKYSTINIHKTGSVEIKLTFVNSHHADFKTIADAVKNIVNLINNINKLDFKLNRTIKGPVKIKPPKFEVEGDSIQLGTNTVISFINTITNFKKIRAIDFNHLANLASSMTPYVVPILEDPSKQKGRKQTNSLGLKYRRINNFKNMPEILSIITQLKEASYKDYDIVHYIVAEFDKSLKEASEFLKEWNIRYGSATEETGRMTQSGIYIKIQSNNFHIEGARNPYILANVYRFVVRLLTIYNDYDKYRKNPKFKKFVIEGKPVEFDQVEEFVPSNVENNNDESHLDFDLEDSNFDDDLSVGNYLNINDELNEVRNEVDLNSGEQITGEGDAAGYSLSDEIGKDQVLKCDGEVELLKDTCKDLCEDNKYKLRRLQRYDNRIFKFKPKGIMKGYARTCQKKFQPYVMHKNPAENPKVVDGSYTFSIRYGSDVEHMNYYICPKVWCPYCEIPIKFSDVVDVKKRKVRSGSCMTGKCPYGDHEVMINDAEEYYDLEMGAYPGFKPNTLHPDNLCMPCCFKKPQNIPESSDYPMFQRCMGHEVEEETVEEAGFYILGRDKIPLSNFRFGLLPILLAKKLFNSKCNSSKLVDGESCYLRAGISNDEKQSFLVAMARIVSEETKVALDLEGLKKMLAEKLTPKLFRSLKNGILEILFTNPKSDKSAYENYKQFILSTDKEIINEEYMWDYLSRPGILFEDGVNIVIVTSGTIICPFGENMSQIYDLSKRTVFLFRHRKYFEPICFATNTGKNITLNYTFSSLNKEVVRCFDLLFKQCKPYNTINWTAILKDNEKRLGLTYDIDLKNEDDLNTVLSGLKKAKIPIEGQLLDQYNKTVAVIIHKNVYVPCKPQGLNTSLKIIEPLDLKLATYSDSVKLLTKMSKFLKLNVMPVKKIVDNGDIVAIMVESGRIIPIKAIKNNNDKLEEAKIPYYSDLDQVIKEGKKSIDQRQIDVNKLDYETEAYNRYKFEISAYLQTDKGNKLKEKLSTLIKDDAISKKEKKTGIIKIIESIEKEIYASSKVHKEIDIEKYVMPNVRVRCETLTKCNDDPYCVKDGSGCKFYVKDKNYFTGKSNRESYTIMLSKELMRNRMKRDQIIKGLIPDIIDKKQFKSTDDVVVLSGTGEKIIRDLAKLYAKDSQFFITSSKMYDTIEPTYPGVDRDKYADYLRDYDVDFFSLEPVSQHWSPYLNNSFSIYINISGNSLLSTVTKSLIKSDMKDVVPNILTLKDKIVDIINKINIKQVQQIATSLSLESLIVEGQDSWELLLDLYQKKCRDSFATVHTLGQMINTITSKTYKGCIVDLYLITIAIDINFILLYKRLTKANEAGYRLFGPGLISSPFYMILYSQNRKGKQMYDSVIGENKYIFTKKELPNEFLNKIFGSTVSEKVVSVEENEEKEDKPKKKTIKKSKIVKKKSESKSGK